MKAGALFPLLLISFFLPSAAVTLSLQAIAYEPQVYEPHNYYLPEEDDLDERDESGYESGYEGFPPLDWEYDNSDNKGYTED